MEFFHLAHCCAIKGYQMQYLSYIQVALLLLLIIMVLWLISISYSNRREFREIIHRLDIACLKGKLKIEPQKSIESCQTSEPISESGNIGKTISFQNDLRFINIEACRNLNTNKYFLILEEINNLHTKLIIPSGEIKILENKLFNEPEDFSLDYLLNNNYISNIQIEAYFNFLNSHTSITPIVNNIAEYDQEEPPYIKNYRSMLSNPDTWSSKMLRKINDKGPITLMDLKNEMDQKYEYSPSESNGSFGASLRVLLVDGHIRIEGKGNSKVIIAQQNV